MSPLSNAAEVRNGPAQARRVSIVTAQGSAILSPPDLSSSFPPDCSGRKRALLIGIRKSNGNGYRELQGAHGDVRKMRSLLIDVYNYAENDITVLLDDNIDGHVQPTRANILSAIADFVRDVQAGDQLLFHYCGHSTQVENRSGSEDDGMDECMVPQDGEENMIIDNDLHRELVTPLPANAHLVAVLDTCHSGSLLDLKHYRCNRVVVPWKWRGKRNSEDIRQNVRRNARLLSLGEVAATFTPQANATQAPTDPAGASQSQIRRRSILSTNDSPAASRTASPASSRSTTALDSRAPSPAPSRNPLARLRPRRRTRTISITAPGKENASPLPPTPAPAPAYRAWILPEDDAHRCDSPTARWACTGWCRTPEEGAAPDDEDPVKADVISLASCKDSQETYEVDGKSMTSSLVDLLRENPNRSIKEVLVSVSHAMYDMALKRHAEQKVYTHKRKAFIAKASRFLAHLERQRNRAKTGEPALAPVLAPAPIGPMPQMQTRAGGGRPRALSMPVRKPTDLIAKVKAKLQQATENRGLDMDSFQNPELASPRPLNMNRPWRM